MPQIKIDKEEFDFCIPHFPGYEVAVREYMKPDQPFDYDAEHVSYASKKAWCEKCRTYLTEDDD